VSPEVALTHEILTHHGFVKQDQHGRGSHYHHPYKAEVESGTALDRMSDIATSLKSVGGWAMTRASKLTDGDVEFQHPEGHALSLFVGNHRQLRAHVTDHHERIKDNLKIMRLTSASSVNEGSMKDAFKRSMKKKYLKDNPPGSKVDDRDTDYIKQYQQKMIRLKTFGQFVKEDGCCPVPANAAGGGHVAGIGIGPDGEPGVKPRRKKKIR
jgi:hypothetical protein